ncbi:hypothetical protein K6L12_03070 [Vibrio parahaemolyticus]|nr:hypothetical protein [Vibrio parahaemolyticus]MBY4623754.1 hypothetical protein [Vibrio parahaemolyticus]
MILDDSYDPDKHGEYFAQFAKFVCVRLLLVSSCYVSLRQIPI